MRKMKKLKKVFGLMLAAVMVFAMCVPALAAEHSSDETFTITITQDDTTTAGNTDYVYKAYQIFAGVLTDTTDEYGNVVSTTLSSITWGSGVSDSDALLAALKADATYGSLFTTCSSAADVAEVLSTNYDNADLANTFAKIAAQYIDASNAYTSGESQMTSDGKYGYLIENLPAGYYLVINTEVPEGSDEATGGGYSDYILQVVEDVSVEAKDDVPDVDKKIIDNDRTDTNVNSTTSEGAYNLGSNETIGPVADYSIGDEITFQLTGTLPGNYDSFDSYVMIFHDTESTGLSFTGAQDVTVWVKDANGDIVQVNSSSYTIVATEAATQDGCTFEVQINDTKSMTDVNNNPIVTDSSSEIYVIYKSVLNSDAEIGNNGNPNEVYMEFSNDSNSNGTGRTKKKIVAAFTFTLDILKTDDTATSANPLEDAEFILYRGTEGSYEYAILDDVNKVSSWTSDKDQATVIKTDEDGNVSVIGLDEGTYYLEETKAPAGYNILSTPITITVEAVYDDEASAQTGYPVVSSLTVTVTGNDLASTTETGGIGDPASGKVGVTVQNHSGSRLPSTGGIGTYIFYIIGGAIVVCAAVVLVTRRRMRRAA